MNKLSTSGFSSTEQAQRHYWFSMWPNILKRLSTLMIFMILSIPWSNVVIMSFRMTMKPLPINDRILSSSFYFFKCECVLVVTWKHCLCSCGTRKRSNPHKSVTEKGNNLNFTFDNYDSHTKHQADQLKAIEHEHHTLDHILPKHYFYPQYI